MRHFDAMTMMTTTTMWLTDDRVASYEGEGDGGDDENMHSSTRRHWANKQDRRQRGPFQAWTSEADLRLPTESIKRDDMVAAR